MAVRSLTVEGLAFPLVGENGDTILADDVAAVSPLVRLVNAAVSGTLGAPEGGATIGQGLEERLARSEPVAGTDLLGAPVQARFVPDTAIASMVGEARRWSTFAGSPVLTNTYLVSTGSDAVLVPRPVLVQLIARLDQLRSGPTAPLAPAPELPPDDLYAAFGIGGSSTEPTRLDRDLAVYLEEQAVIVDALELADTLPSLASAKIKRILLLDTLESLGLLSGPDETARVLLDTSRAGRVLGYVAAADELRAYLRSRTRRQLIPEPRSMAVIGAPVSLDWFRLAASTPAGVDPDLWLAHWERVVAGGDLSGTFGDDGRRYAVAVRDEGGPLPAVLRVVEV